MVQLLAKVDRAVPGKDIEKALKEVDELIELIEFCDLSSTFRKWKRTTKGKWVLHPEADRAFLKRYPMFGDLVLKGEPLWSCCHESGSIDLTKNLGNLKQVLQQLKEGTP